MSFINKSQIYNYWLASTPGLTPAKRKKLIDLSGGASSLFGNKNLIMDSRLDIKDFVKKKLCDRMNEDLLLSEIYSLNAKGINITTIDDDDYPSLLKEIHDPPYMLYYKGDLSRLAKKRIAVVGTREPSYSGISNIRKICEELSASGLSIISGLARGVDTVAAKAAIFGGTPTAAVLGCGIDIPYPKENADLYYQICNEGVLLSEYPPGIPPLAENFPPRNRIISGMAHAVFIAEGRIKSGGAITVRNAIEQNRDVYAMPGDISNPMAELPNSLIADGAIVVLGSKTILDSMNTPAYFPLFEEKNDIELDFSEKQIYTLLKRGELTAEAISNLSGMDISTVNLNLTMLEIKKAVVRLPGNTFTINRSR